MNIARWEPFKEMQTLMRQYSPFFSGELSFNGDKAEWKPLADISEGDKEYLIKAQLPGVKKEDVKITLNDGVITISGERKNEKEQKDANQIRVESFYGAFARSFELPENVDAKAIHAESKDGVLNVHLPKTASKKSEPLKIEVK